MQNEKKLTNKNYINIYLFISRHIGNILWLISFGLIIFSINIIIGSLLYISIIGRHFGIRLFNVAKFSIWPFGKIIIIPNQHINSRSAEHKTWINIVGGWYCTLVFILGILLCSSIIFIPFGLQCFKIALFAWSPFEYKHASRPIIVASESPIYIQGLKRVV